MRDALAELLHVVSMDVHAYDRVETFLAAYAPGAFDCLITDLRMPGRDGLDLLRELKARGSSMPVIVVTASMDSLSRSRAVEYGAFAYLTKPVRDEVLIRHLMAALGRGGPPEESGGNRRSPTG